MSLRSAITGEPTVKCTFIVSEPDNMLTYDMVLEEVPDIADVVYYINRNVRNYINRDGGNEKMVIKLDPFYGMTKQDGTADLESIKIYLK